VRDGVRAPRRASPGSVVTVVRKIARGTGPRTTVTYYKQGSDAAKTAIIPYPIARGLAEACLPEGDRQEGSGILLPTCVLCGLESNRPCRCGFALHDNEGSVEGTYCATALVLHHRFVEYGQPKGDRQEGSG